MDAAVSEVEVAASEQSKVYGATAENVGDGGSEGNSTGIVTYCAYAAGEGNDAPATVAAASEGHSGHVSIAG